MATKRMLKQLDPLMIRVHDKVQGFALRDETLVVFRLLTGASVMSLTDGGLIKRLKVEDFNCLAVTSSPKQVFVALADGSIKQVTWESIGSGGVKSDNQLEASVIRMHSIVTSVEASASDDSLLYAAFTTLDQQRFIGQIDASNSKIVTQLFSPHTDTINRIRALPDNHCVVMSAGEDGLCGMWDMRSGKLEGSLVPNDMSEVQRHAAWLSCLDFSADARFFVTGGGPKLAIYDVRGLLKGPVAGFKGDDKFCPYVGQFSDCEFVSGGVGGKYCLYRMAMDGNVVGRGIKCSMQVVNSLVINTQPKLTMCVGGIGSTVDVFNNLAYMSYSFEI